MGNDNSMVLENIAMQGNNRNEMEFMSLSVSDV